MREPFHGGALRCAVVGGAELPGRSAALIRLALPVGPGTKTTRTRRFAGRLAARSGARGRARRATGLARGRAGPAGRAARRARGPARRRARRLASAGGGGLLGRLAALGRGAARARAAAARARAARTRAAARPRGAARRARPRRGAGAVAAARGRRGAARGTPAARAAVAALTRGDLLAHDLRDELVDLALQERLHALLLATELLREPDGLLVAELVGDGLDHLVV